MIITKTPLRITLGGGGTDLHPGGVCVAAAINQHIYIAINDNFDDEYLLKYSEVERVSDPDDIHHELLRRIIKRTKLPRGVEISSMADIPAGTGLGSSGSFTVGVLNAISHYRYPTLPADKLNSLACELDIGWQDQTIAVYGGICVMTENDVDHLDISAEMYRHLNEHLCLFYTGIRRSAAEVLAEQEIDLVNTRAMGLTAADALTQDPAVLAGLLTEQWLAKRAQTPEPINSIIERGLTHGALGGKLVGAGGGGFVLFYATDKYALRRELEDLREVDCTIDPQGSRCFP